MSEQDDNTFFFFFKAMPVISTAKRKRQEKGKEAKDNILALKDESETAHETIDQKKN